MRKIIMTVLVGLALTLGLAVAPASGQSGSITLWEELDKSGDSVTRLESQIPQTCTAIPSELSVVKSVFNDTFSLGTSVDFFSQADSQCTTVLATVGPAADPNDYVNIPSGAGYWMVSSS